MDLRRPIDLRRRVQGRFDSPPCNNDETFANNDPLVHVPQNRRFTCQVNGVKFCFSLTELALHFQTRANNNVHPIYHNPHTNVEFNRVTIMRLIDAGVVIHPVGNEEWLIGEYYRHGHGLGYLISAPRGPNPAGRGRGRGRGRRGRGRGV